VQVQVQVRVLGGLEVLVGDQPVDAGGRKQRTVLAVLLAARPGTVSNDRLVDLVWGDEAPAQAVVSLQTYVARLRRALEPSRGRRVAAAVLVTRGPGYALVLDDGAVDAVVFTQLVEQAQPLVPADPARADELLTRALDLWHGEPYAGLAEHCSVLAAEARRLGDLRWTAVEARCEARLARADPGPQLLVELDALLEAQPLRERAWELKARALYRLGRQADALATLRRARALLRDELGIDPGPGLRQLEEAVLRQEPGLDPPRPAGAAVVRAGLPGRTRELSRTAAALDDAARGRTRVLLVTGEAGVGKTRLCAAVVEQARERGFRTGWGGWDPAGTPPLWAWHECLRGLGASDDVLDPGATCAASAVFRAAAQVVEQLQGPAPSLLVLDDVHWADADSLRLLRRVVTTLRRAPVALLLTCRSTPADHADGVRDLLAAVARADGVRLPLNGLDADAVQALVRDLTGNDVPAEVAAALVDRTEGNPFFVRELALLLADDRRRGRTGELRELPGGVRDVVRDRVHALPQPARELLAAASVPGRSFDVDVVAAALGWQQDDVEPALLATVAAGLVAEEAPGRFRFVHAVVRDAVYDELPAPARTRAHAATAHALERLRVGRTDAHVTELAEHYRLGGPACARPAWLFAVRAGRTAANVGAPEEAVRLLSVAAEAQLDDALRTAQERESVLVQLGGALHATSRPAEAWSRLAAAGASALGRRDAVRAASALLVITRHALWTWRPHGETDDDAVHLWEQVLEELPASEPVLMAQVRAALALELLYRPDAAQRCTELADQAVLGTRRSGSAQELLHVLHMTHLALQRPDLLDRRVPVSDELVVLAGRLDSPADTAVALCKRAADRAEAGRWDSACADLTRAHAVAVQQGLVPVLLVAGWGLALVAQAAGDAAGAEQAVERLESLQEIASEGHRPRAAGDAPAGPGPPGRARGAPRCRCRADTADARPARAVTGRRRTGRCRTSGARRVARSAAPEVGLLLDRSDRRAGPLVARARRSRGGARPAARPHALRGPPGCGRHVSVLPRQRGAGRRRARAARGRRRRGAQAAAPGRGHAPAAGLPAPCGGLLADAHPRDPAVRDTMTVAAPALETCTSAWTTSTAPGSTWRWG
jgi:DNA-binding SARP family transcriptional activator